MSDAHPPAATVIDSTNLQAVLHLDALGGDRFVAATLSPNMNGDIFGGQYLANVVGAAMLATERRRPHAMQAFFLRAGKLELPLEYAVSRIREGQRFAHRRVEVHQAGRLLMTADVSLHSGNGAHAHQADPPRMPTPEQLENLDQLALRHVNRMTPATIQRMLGKKAVEARPVDCEAGIFRAANEARFSVWLKPVARLPADAFHQYCALTYLSDYWIGAVPTARYAASIFAREHAVLSLNHSLWFHAEPSTADWLLYDLDSPNSGNGLGLGHGRFFDRRGKLLASAQQEVLMS
jgi:acyl-CoA thioesterase-2